MSAGSISSLGASSGAGTSADAFGSLSSTDFMKILTTELTQQDPFKPTDSSQILSQLSDLRNIQSQMDLQTQLQSLVNQNMVAQASSLIGKTVQGLDNQNNQVTGKVTSVRVVNGKPVLELDTGKSLSMANLQMINDTPVATTT